MEARYSIEIHRLYISEGHNFKGRFGKEPLHHDIPSKSSVLCVEGKGLVGDRYFDYKDNWKGQITFMAQETVDAMEARFSATPLDPSVFRRNVIASGIEWNDLVGKVFRIGEARFEGTERCAPCFWMDQAVAPGALEALQDRGGLRCRILSSGSLALGPAQLVVES